MAMRISFVMINNHDLVSLIENRLDSVSAEYQSVDNKVEIYRLDGDLIILEINQNMFSILYKESKYDFGSWQDVHINKIFESLKWVNKNNIKFPKTIYWYEIKKENGEIINVENYIENEIQSIDEKESYI